MKCIVENIASIAALISVVILAYQMHLLKKEVKIGTYFKLIENAFMINRIFIEYPYLSKLLPNIGYVDHKASDETVRAQWLAILLLDFFESIYYAYRSGVIPE